MRITRRKALSTILLSTLSGCSAISGRKNSPGWSAPVGSNPLTERIYVDEEYVAVTTPTGGIQLFSTDSGTPVGNNNSRENDSRYAGTPTVSVDKRFLTITDQIHVVNDSGEEIWSESLPDGGYASIESPPVILNGLVYTTTSEGSMYQIDLQQEIISEIDLPPISGYWWDSRGSRVVLGTKSYDTTLCDLNSTEVLWSQSGTSLAHPCLYDTDIITSSIESGQLNAHRVNPDTGMEQWNASLPGIRITFCDRLSDGVLAVVSQNAWESSEPGQVTMIDANSGTITEKYGIPPKTIPSGDVFEGTLFLTTFDGAVLSIAPESGLRELFKYEDKISSPPTVRGENIVFGTNDGQVVLIEY
ncbi:PQQ-binding-like beta-propeller repeat protein [Halogeometricum borinquense]|uniref:PQQ-binding-like beta-propeller repeat protein n=1 Tax=Halogeometricum borinquense TaxID=60847 RepID=A0A6C0UK93_9EURY|nr:PQQ-binding-like beta-propeller repeat protein [Halogeometricum borinquense]QIB75657.1 PQQ-binding-like beta-propeller repeat protein [Halogeometricum borinquense]